MIVKHDLLIERLEKILDLIDVPESYYKLAILRYDSLYRWFIRKESGIRDFSPYVYSQGSFRLGTVTRPLGEKEEYDLDIVCQLALTKKLLTQKRLKELVGIEVQSYAKANNFKEPASEKKRCWRLDYADDVRFHMDILPCIPDDASVIQLLIEMGVEPEHAALAVAITDNRHAMYDSISSNWPRSNSNGYGKWFEERMRKIAESRIKSLVEKRAYAKVDEVPVFEWKTPLQRSIQILKRHCDVMFHESSELKPISIVISTLAARAYNGEPDIGSALTAILDSMPSFVRNEFPRVGNPVNPLEDFAERWKENPKLERNFWIWHRQATADLTNIGQLTEKRAKSLINERFEIEYRGSAEYDDKPSFVTPAIVIPSTQTSFQRPPKPWGARR